MKKLPVKPFLLAAIFLLLITACKKQSYVDLTPIPSPNGRGIQVRLTSEEQAMLADLLSREGVKDSADFLNKIRYVKSQSSHQKSSLSATSVTTTNTNSYDEGSEEISIGDFYSAAITEMNTSDPGYSQIANLAAQYPNSTIKGYKAVGTHSTYFVIRGNQVMFNVPYVVGLKISSVPEIVKVSEMPGAPPSILPVGSYWGTYTASPYPAYVQGMTNHSATVHAEGSEVRTEVRSVQGAIKISTEADAGVFQAGVEMEAGFTIQSANNIYNQYILNGTFSVQLLSPPGDWGEPPMFNFASSLKCAQYGVLRNQ